MWKRYEHYSLCHESRLNMKPGDNNSDRYLE